jgi:hypothetical protein
MSAQLEILRLALHKVSKPDSKPGPGRVRGTATLRVAFDLKVGEPYTSRVANAVPWKKIAAVALSKLNAASMAEVVRQAFDESTDFEDVAARAEGLCESLLDATTRECEGKVTGTTSIVEANVVLE